MNIVYTHRKKQASPFKDSRFLYSLIAFLLPTLILAGLLVLRGIWWGSSTTILASDSFHQYAIFYQALGNALRGQGSLFYNFNSGLGLNFYALSSYYLGSFLSVFVYFFQLKNIPDFIYLATLVKFGLTGLSSYLTLQSIYQKIHPALLMSLSLSYSLMSFTTSQLELFSWLDVFILLPLIIMGSYRLLTGKGGRLYYISLSILLFQNYYFGYMICLFLVLFVLCILSWDWRKRVVHLFDFTLVSISAVLTSMVMLWPTILDLQRQGETFTALKGLQIANRWYLDLVAKYLTGSFDTTKFDSIPMIYVGLLPLLLAGLFFTIREIKVMTKLVHGLSLAVILMSFYVEPLNLFWQGMHAPNMFLYRYAWTLSIFLVYLGAEVLSRINQIRITSLYQVFGIIIMLVILTYVFRDRYEFLKPIQFILTVEFLVVYALMLWTNARYQLPWKVFSVSLLAFITLELSLHTYYQLEGLAQEWHFPSRNSYEEKLTDVDELVKESQASESDFFRTERLLPQTGNDSMKFQYNGVSQFSSIRNRYSSSTLDKLGFRSDGTNLNLRYQNNTLIADSLFGIKYNLATTNPLKYGFQFLQSRETINLYRNQFSQQLAILTDGIYKDVTFTHLTLDNQTLFLNQLAGLQERYFYPLQPLSSKNATEFDGRTTVTKTDTSELASVQYTIDVPKDSQLYLHLSDLVFSNEQHNKVVLTVNGLSNEFTLDNAFPFFNAGFYLENQLLTVTLSFPQNEQVRFSNPQFFRLDLDAFEKAVTILQEKEVEATTKDNRVFIRYQSPAETSLLITLPYDKGWSARLNGQPISVEQAQTGFMKLRVPKGSGEVELRFIPYGLDQGILLSLSGIFVFVFYDWAKGGKKSRLSPPKSVVSPPTV